ncbi:hypothetical protein IWW39_000583 [Coemansia spiralis]|uniref:Uncharacterized protein n=1 Tax=Coemansia spiralis TaxID=417178 RepID=A0A9W8GPI7_9FUNG|nr:hypothetical protein IWW39_000583 [Coemansia spiralis]
MPAPQPSISIMLPRQSCKLDCKADQKDKSWDELTSEGGHFEQYCGYSLCIKQDEDYHPVDHTRPLGELVPEDEEGEFVFHVIK